MINIIKVDAIGSTNVFLKKAVRSGSITKPTCIWALNQTEGRGQMGTSWEVESGKNLTFSVYLPVLEEVWRYPITINLLTTLSIQLVLEKLEIPKIKIKWPNDILSAKKKLAGILIENNYQNGVCTGSVIGVGINVNQLEFANLPNATSLKKESLKEFDLELLLNEVLKELEVNINSYSSKDFKVLKKRFEQVLFRKDQVSSFKKTLCNTFFNGIIQGITTNGELVLLEENNILNNYSLKELQLLY